mmetsp:Transcript_6632/g.10381  ORF Transcript_6632/g.10381 Transcript_6632/m.10381 type:complete len:319 (-) Transcript_6632:286-1242(-)
MGTGTSSSKYKRKREGHKTTMQLREADEELEHSGNMTVEVHKWTTLPRSLKKMLQHRMNTGTSKICPIMRSMKKIVLDEADTKAKTQKSIVEEQKHTKREEISRNAIRMFGKLNLNYEGKVPLNVVNGDVEASPAQANLLNKIGGSAKLTKLCTRFYTKFLEDQLLRTFRIEEDGPDAHGMRLADWITEKMGGEGTPATDKGRANKREWQHIKAYFAPKRDQTRQGQRFQLDDCRTWMRLMFWSAREEGLDKFPMFWNWFLEFISFYIDIYQMTAPPYVKRDAAWSIKKDNIEKYLSDNKLMRDIIGVGPLPEDFPHG